MTFFISVLYSDGLTDTKLSVKNSNDSTKSSLYIFIFNSRFRLFLSKIIAPKPLTP